MDKDMAKASEVLQNQELRRGKQRSSRDVIIDSGMLIPNVLIKDLEICSVRSEG
jgi:hypothetical protein